MPDTTLIAPDNWELYSGEPPLVRFAVPPDSTTIDSYYAALQEWARNERLRLVPSAYALIAYTDYASFYMWSAFEYHADTNERANDRLFGTWHCPSCDSEISQGTILCACGRIQACNNCSISGLPLSRDGFCPACLAECPTEGCTNLYRAHDQQADGDTFTACDSCQPRRLCYGCARLFLPDNMSPYTAAVEIDEPQFLCSRCEIRVCESCNEYSSSTTERPGSHNMCNTCWAEEVNRARAEHEVWDSEELPVSGSMILPSSAVRPIRTISIETEFDGSGSHVANALHRNGLIHRPTLDSYSRPTGDDRYPCFLKRDGSVSGGELVTFLLNLDNENHAAALLRMTEVMRSCRELGEARFTSNAGGHIHIDLHDFTIQDVWRYHTLFGFMESTIFFLAGAGAPYGHRTMEGSGYTPPIMDPLPSAQEFARNLEELMYDRYALNLIPILNSLRSCRCGALIAGELENCTCEHNKATAEWRVFNAEITPRILHGWLALVQSFTAHVQGMDGFDAELYPRQYWHERPFSELSDAAKDDHRARLEYIHRELPLTIHERDSLIYVAKRSELIGLGSDYLDSLIEIRSENEFAEKKQPRNPLARVGAFTFEMNTDLSPSDAPLIDFDEDPDYYEEDY